MSDLNRVLDTKADATETTLELSKKSSSQELNTKIAEIIASLEEKADLEFVQRQLEKKANSLELEAKMAQKANISDIQVFFHF